MNDDRHEKLTQVYCTWGDKLLQHCDVLNDMQNNRKIRPITIQISLTEACDCNCSFCSVAERPKNRRIPWSKYELVLDSFKQLGAKSVELTGGGNPLLYRDGDRNIVDAILLAKSKSFDVGLITNSSDLSILTKTAIDCLSWVRISLAKLDEGLSPSEYRLENVASSDDEKLSFSYIVNEKTSMQTLEKIADVVEMYPRTKFVRFAGNCLVRGNNELVRLRFADVIDENERYKKFFIKSIDADDVPFNDACYVGAIRPYVAPAADDREAYSVYTCTSHVLETRKYDADYALCRIEDIGLMWNLMNRRFAAGEAPYAIRRNGGKNWCTTCMSCYYKNNNKLLHTVATEMPDKNFP